ncbi:hypothetical protein USB125703_01526 [Pseudoclavibacter triregionum]|nr:hypothetical protein USB125703_01526 [Pseudoclavibacter triregionum]
MTNARDRFDPNRSLPEIDPHAGAGDWAGATGGTRARTGRRIGGTAAPHDPAAAPTDPPQPEPGAAPWARRSVGAQLVRTTTGAPAAPAPVEAPPAPRGFERPRGGDAPYEEAKPLKGKKAIAAYEREQAERRRRAEEEARRAADRESRGVAGFADRTTRARGVSISNPDYAPVAGEEAFEAGPPTAPKPWYRRVAIVLPLVLLLVAGLGFGLGWPAYLQVRATAEADAASDAYARAMTAYELAWSEENLDALVAALPSTSLTAVDEPLAQPYDAQQRLDSECAKLDAASRAASELSTSGPPSLAPVAGSDFSTRYQETAAADAGFAAERRSAQTLLDAIRATLPELGAFCTNFRLGLAIENEARTRDDAELQPLRTVAFGQAIDIQGRSFTCDVAAGCPDYRDEAARKLYADLWEEIWSERDVKLGAHLTGECWLGALVPYCVKMADAVEVRRDHLQPIASAIDSDRPDSQDPAGPALPRLTAELRASATAYADAERLAYLEAGRVDPAVLADKGPEWETRMITRMLAAFEAHLAEAATGYRGSAGI